MGDGEGERDSLKGQTEAFLREFFEKGESLVRELIVENERLRGRMSSLDEHRAGQPLPTPENIDEGMVSRLVERVAILERECDEIRKIAGSVQQKSGGYRSRLESLEEEHYDLASRYVAGSQFQSALTIEEVLRTITEILLNFVGVGAFTILAVDEERQVLFPVAREGGDPTEVSEASLTAAPFDAAAGLGRPWRAGDPTYVADGVLGNLPLYSGSRLMGVARLEALLTQKSSLSAGDLELLALVSERAGIGIETAWIRAHAKEVALQREAVEHLVGA